MHFLEEISRMMSEASVKIAAFIKREYLIADIKYHSDQRLNEMIADVKCEVEAEREARVARRFRSEPMTSAELETVLIEMRARIAAMRKKAEISDDLKNPVDDRKEENPKSGPAEPRP